MLQRYVILTLLLLTAFGLHSAENEGPEKWEEDIAKFEAKDKESFPPEGAVLFIGSSSIRGWDLEKWFPNHKTINRGFGGSQIEDSLYYAGRIVIPYKPGTIVFYAGDNDIAKGKTPKQVFWDYQAFVKKVHDALPDTEIIFVAIKPSMKRWELVDKMRKANYSIREWSNNYPYLKFLDIDSPMIGADGKPKKELFAEDGLHLNEAGYKLWSGLLKQKLPPPKLY